jgi:putative DNA primase/helicase
VVEYVGQLNSYTEISPSGTGLRVITRAKLPAGGRKRGNIECYESRRYLTISGNHYPGCPTSINVRQQVVDAVHAAVFGHNQDKKGISGKAHQHNGSHDSRGGTDDGHDPSDDDVLEHARGAANGARFTALYDHGNLSQYDYDDSRGDLALCSVLAFWCGPNAAQIDRLFRSSALMRDKWDSARGDSTYGAWTINKALEGKTEFFDWQANARRQEAERAKKNDPAQRMPEHWPEPGNVAPKLMPVPKSVPQMLPEGFREWLMDVAHRLQCPLDYPAVAALVSTSSVIGRQLAIRPKRHDDWTVVPNVWGGIIGPPGDLKSPALNEGTQPLHELRRKAANDHRNEMANYEFDELVTKARRDEIGRELRTAIRAGDQKKVDELRAEYDESNQPEPVERRYSTSDTTVEKLGELLNENPRGLLILCDELTGFLKGLERSGHEQDRAFYLEAWGGDGSFDFDRIGRGTLHIDATCVSILGSIQPDPLRSYLLQTFIDGRNDGFIQRFQLLVYPDSPANWKNIDRTPDAEAKKLAHDIFNRLHQLDVASIGAVQTDGRLPYVRFTDEAQDFFDEWRTDLENRIRDPEEAPVMAAHLAKFRSLMPSLALLFWLIESFEGFEGTQSGHVVSLRAAQMAAAWCDFLEAHARRIFQTVTLRHRAVADALAKKIKDGKLPNPFTSREIYNSGWADLSNPEDVMHALEVLEDAGWVELFETKNLTGGRPKVLCYINPKILGSTPK